MILFFWKSYELVGSKAEKNADLDIAYVAFTLVDYVTTEHALQRINIKSRIK